MSASYSAMKKASSKGRESLRNKRKGNSQWNAPENLARAGSKKKTSNSPRRGKGYDKKKLSKVVALFNKDVFNGLDIKNVLNNWRILQYVFLSLGGKKPLEIAVNTYFLNCYKKQYARFLRGFTKYNKIKKKIFIFMFLESWAFYLLFYFHYQVGSVIPEVRVLFEDILTHLTKNTFYVGLILLKAASNRVLGLNVGYLQDFVNRSQTFNFQTGVPLIKTLRSNNENAYEGIKRVLQFTNRSLNKFFIESYAKDFNDFNQFISFASPVYVNQLINPQKNIFKKMQDSHFYGKETFSGKYASIFSQKLRKTMTPQSFILGSLDISLNSWLTPDSHEKERKLSRTLNDRSEKGKKSKRESSLSEKQALREESKRDRNKASVRSRNSGAGRSKISSKYSIQQSSQSRKSKNIMSSRNYKLKVSNSKRFKDISNGESPKRLKEVKSSKISSLASKKKLDRSLKKQSSRAFKNSRQASIKDKEKKHSKKIKNLSIVSSSKGSLKGRSNMMSSELKIKKKLLKGDNTEKAKNGYSSKRGLSKTSRENSIRKRVNSKKALQKTESKKIDSRNGSQIRYNTRNKINQRSQKKHEIPSLRKMMLELRGKNKAGSKRNESIKQSDEDSDETEVSQNHLRKLENMAKNINMGNKIKKEVDSSQKKIKEEKEEKEEIIKPKKNKLEKNKNSPKSKSIVPSESYAQNIGLGRQVTSPLLSSKNKKLSKSKQRMKSKPAKTKEAKTTPKQEAKSSSMVPIKKIDPRSANYGNKQVKLQQKYTQNNAMTHTPNPKMSNYNHKAHSRKSQTPEPKGASNLINNLHREPLITTDLKDRKYCLVLDLDETLIHFKNDNGRAKFLIRPYTYNFLRNLEPHFELIIFTAAQKEYADWILDKIDNKVGF